MPPGQLVQLTVYGIRQLGRRALVAISRSFKQLGDFPGFAYQFGLTAPALTILRLSRAYVEPFVKLRLTAGAGPRMHR